MINKQKKSKAEVKDKKNLYYYAVGRRKSATAQARLSVGEKTSDEMIVNKKKMSEYFPTIVFQNIFTDPLRVAGILGKSSITMTINGGGSRGQAEAARLAISRAVVKFDESMKTALRAAGFLTRDARKVERKKAGLKKARRAPQWQKR